MKVIVGDIWDYAKNGNGIVIPGNIGWNKLGKNVMGRGVAQQASFRYRSIADYFGSICQLEREKTGLIVYVADNGCKLFFFPVKPFNEEKPWMSWAGKADIDLIIKSLGQLKNVFNRYNLIRVYLPLVGCGNGGLEVEEVLPLLNKGLDDRFMLVILSGDSCLEKYRIVNEHIA